MKNLAFNTAKKGDFLSSFSYIKPTVRINTNTNDLLNFGHHKGIFTANSRRLYMLNSISSFYTNHFYLYHSKTMETKPKEPQLKKPKEETKGLKEKYNKDTLENTLLRRFFIVPAFEIYGGSAGLYDLGPPGSALKQNIEQYWREHFILEENMLELSPTNLTPYEVFKASGHVEQFSDFMVKDLKKGTPYRADKIVQEFIDKKLAKEKKLKPEEIEKLKKIHQDIEKLEGEDIDKVIEELKVTSPEGNPLSKANKFNLMFGTQLGPDHGSLGFLRPETAQGQFVNFKRLLEYNGGKLPFASANVGVGFRNEISPRSGLLRGREFLLAEIEHFVDPLDKRHKKFHIIKDLTIPLWTADNQRENKYDIIRDMTLGEAVEKRIINNESLAYFIGRTYQYLITLGINEYGIRFRQHNTKEMAHYASDCWDAEIETSYGWIEVVGHADRAAFDLTCHAKATGKELVASRPLPEPVVLQKVRVKQNKGTMYKQFKDQMKRITEVLDNLSDEAKETYLDEFTKTQKTLLKVDDQTIEISADFLSFERYTEKITEEKFVPGVIEPAFGIGRILYCVLEHCFRIRKEDSKRTFFAFPPIVAPYKVSILPLIYNEEIYKFIEPLRKSLVNLGISYKIDDIAEGIGKRYARTDEVGIPFACTIDEKTIKDGTVTLREITDMKQVRLPVSI